MTTTLNKLQNAFQHEGTNISNVLKLLPAAMKEMARIKANGNQLGFIKDGDLWYADLHNWPLDRSHLLMVAGADDLLDEFANGKRYVTMKISQHDSRIKIKPGEALLELLWKEDNGFSGTYKVNGHFETKQVWLCPVVNFVFLKVPKFIWFSKV
jgi:hypothetical protein